MLHAANWITKHRSTNLPLTTAHLKRNHTKPTNNHLSGNLPSLRPSEQEDPPKLKPHRCLLSEDLKPTAETAAILAAQTVTLATRNKVTLGNFSTSFSPGGFGWMFISLDGHFLICKCVQWFDIAQIVSKMSSENFYAFRIWRLSRRNGQSPDVLSAPPGRKSAKPPQAVDGGLEHWIENTKYT